MSNLGGWAIGRKLADYIVANYDGTILELGSGEGTGYLANYFDMVSIEHDQKFLEKYDSQYIYAPIKMYSGMMWYDIIAITEGIKDVNPSLILVDGPPGRIGRMGFYHNFQSFPRCDVVIDDVQRRAEYNLAERLKPNFDDSFVIEDGDKQAAVLKI